MKELDSLKLDQWRDVNGGLILAYLDCYSKLSKDKNLNKAEQLHQSLMIFDPTTSEATQKFYNSAYTIARELGIFYEENNNIYLSQSAINLIEQPVGKLSYAIQKYMQGYVLNTEFIINNKVVHPLKVLITNFGDNEFSLEEMKQIEDLVPSSVTSPNETSLKYFLNRLALADFLTISNNKYKFKNSENIVNKCTVSELSLNDFKETFIGDSNHKNVVKLMIDRGIHDSINKLEEVEVIQSKIGQNKIIYGAPGAGKSASIKRFIEKEASTELQDENYIRTVFHPETQYSDFIGCLKPHKDSSGSITYSFRKGPFIQILEKALLDKENHYFLVIEELNRANTAAVFGEVFQLLDRDDEGKSEYPIIIQDADLYDYLTSIKELSVHANISKRELIIPSNLSIIATMNSSDQAVFPLDTAFKRRWIFEYLPIDFTNCATGEVPIHHADLPKVEWKTLAQTINKILGDLKIVEDKFIGPWFIKDSDLAEGQAEQTFIGKICSYLWDDALKYKNKDEIFRSDIHGYGELYQMYSEKKPIFSEKFMETLKTMQNLDTDTSDKLKTE